MALIPILIIIIIQHTSIGADRGEKTERTDQWPSELHSFANQGLTGSWTDH